MKLIVSNLKMFLNGYEIKNYLEKLKNYENKNIVICPSTIHIPYFLGYKFNVGIQNITYRSNLNQTGEVSALQCKNLGVNYVIVGHHERRKMFNETNKEINLKIKEAIKNNLKVILCVDNLDLKNELKECLKDINEDVIIAYEPLNIVGTNLIEEPKNIENVINYIKSECPNIKVLYGGNINSSNIKNLNQIPNIDGYLIGLSSSKIDEFIKIIKYVNNI